MRAVPFGFAGFHDPNTFYISNAADVKYLIKVQDPGIVESDRMKGIIKPIIGYLGMIHNGTVIELFTS